VPLRVSPPHIDSAIDFRALLNYLDSDVFVMINIDFAQIGTINSVDSLK
jgi:hypothetical protein